MAGIVKTSVLEMPAKGQTETETLTCPAAAPAAMLTVAVTSAAVAFTLLTLMPADGENWTPVTFERLLPVIVRATVLPGDPVAGFRDAICGACNAGRGLCTVWNTPVEFLDVLAESLFAQRGGQFGFIEKGRGRRGGTGFEGRDGADGERGPESAGNDGAVGRRQRRRGQQEGEGELQRRAHRRESIKMKDRGGGPRGRFECVKRPVSGLGLKA